MPFLEFRRVLLDRKSTRLNSSHGSISYAVFCLKKQLAPLGARDLRRSRLRVTRGRWCTARPAVRGRHLWSRRDASCDTCFANHLVFFFLTHAPPRISPLSPHRPPSV